MTTSDTVDIETFHRELVETPSHEDVTAVRTLVKDRLQAAGVDATVDAAGNLIATKGDGDPHLLLNTHLDTVPPHYPYDRQEVIPGSDETAAVALGRGSCDAKGSVAPMVAAFLEAGPTDGRVTLALTPNEETVQSGAVALRDRLSFDAAIIGEPTGLDVCHAARGRFGATVTLSGDAAHASQPTTGANAITAAKTVLEAIERFDAEHGPGTHDQLGSPTLTPTTINGGEAFNQVPASCTIELDRRTVPPETAAGFKTALTEHLTTAVPDDIGLTVELESDPDDALTAFSTPTSASVVTELATIAGGEVRPFGAATEASYFASQAPTVVFGPGALEDEYGPVAHAEREYIRLAELEKAATILRDAIARLT